MASKIETSHNEERTKDLETARTCNAICHQPGEIDEQPSRLIMRAYHRLFARRSQQARQPLTVDQLLLQSFGPISPAYLFSAVFGKAIEDRDELLRRRETQEFRASSQWNLDDE